jgi:acetate kinase
MAHRILVVNCGSSSLKFAYLEGGVFLADGLFDRLGGPDACVRCTFSGETVARNVPDATHESALAEAVALLERRFGAPLPVDGVGHRVVHGGEFLRSATVVDEEVIAKIEQCNELAPLHNPANIVGIQLAQKAFPDVPHVTVFDTAFHQTMPRRTWMYAVPRELYERHRLRRYGMHGTSHEYVSGRAALALGRPLESLHLVVAHLGNGCSACAVREGRSVDTTMGLTPLEGLMMGTRSGDVDPNIHAFLERVAGMSAAETSDMLNRRSGLLGVSGVSNDMRTVQAAAAAGNDRAEAAIELFCHRLAKGILAMSASLDRLDAIVFTGGIGENSAAVRSRAAESLRVLGVEIDTARNAVHGATSGGRISTDTSQVACLVIPTSEERAIAEQTAAFLKPA